MTVSAAKAYTLWVNTQTVSVELRHSDNADEYVLAEIVGAMRRAPSHRATSFGGVMLSGDEVVWHVPVSLLNAELPIGQEDYQIRHGDRIIEAARVDVDNDRKDQIRWVVLSASLVTLGSRWRCLCRQEVR